MTNCFFKLIFTPLAFVLITTIAYSQNKIDASGEYFYKSEHYFESLLLKSNGEFLYTRNQEFTSEKITGNWQLRNNMVVLDSRPQRDKLLVYEHYKNRIKGAIIYVYDKDQELIHYSLTAVNALNDTIRLKYQWRFSKIGFQIKSFYLKNSNGLTSPIYHVQGTHSNEFKVLFETTRVFENESWSLKEDKIIPKNAEGYPEKYFLIKKKAP
ncbi:hypothetical protein BH09BAC6_BH09BAC6_22960 [soil metagenome]|jgi:hypothetical protein